MPADAYRPALDRDVPAVVALVESAYRGEASRAGWTTEAHLLDGQRTDVAEIRASLPHLVLAVDDDQLLGCCVVRPEGRGAYFGTFAVRPGGQGRGTGAGLLAEAERRARSWGAEHVEMTVLAQRPDLQAWYVRRGYARTGEQRPFPYGDQRYGVPRTPDLVFDVLVKRLDPG